MSQKFFTLVTNLGAGLLAQATATGTQLKITQMAVGDGNGDVPSPQPTQTKLVNEVRRAAVNSIFVDEDNKNYIIIEQVIPPEEGGFYIREIGIFDENDNLIAIGNCPPSYKPILSEGSGRTQVIRTTIMIENSDSVTLKIDASTVLATRKYADELVASAIKEHEQSTNHPDATTKSKGFVQLDSSTDSDSETKAATPKAVSEVMAVASSAVKYTTDKDGNKYVDEDTDFKKELMQNGNKVINEAMNVAYITETFLSEDGLSWYRIWSDGWIEQGGYYTNTSSPSEVTVNLLIQHSNSNYNLQITSKRDLATSTSTNIRDLGYISKGISSFVKKISSTTNESGFNWSTMGY